MKVVSSHGNPTRNQKQLAYHYPIVYNFGCSCQMASGQARLNQQVVGAAMGANYEMLIAPASSTSNLQLLIGDFLAACGFPMVRVSNLDSVEINDDRVILLSPSINGRVQILADSAACGITMSDWFDNNPLASHLSSRQGSCIHLWSLDSGFVAGYSAFSHGRKTECECVFSKHANCTREIIYGVRTPTQQPGQILGSRFAASMSRCKNLESGLGELVSGFGFAVHLAELHEAIDDKHGIVIENGSYRFVALENWTILQFVGGVD